MKKLGLTPTLVLGLWVLCSKKPEPPLIIWLGDVHYKFRDRMNRTAARSSRSEKFSDLNRYFWHQNYWLARRIREHMHECNVKYLIFSQDSRRLRVAFFLSVSMLHVCMYICTCMYQKIRKEILVGHETFFKYVVKNYHPVRKKIQRIEVKLKY
jgi:hypothetical protein